MSLPKEVHIQELPHQKAPLPGSFSLDKSPPRVYNIPMVNLPL